MPVSRTDTVLAALRAFANSVQADAELGTRIQAGPEDQLKRSVPELVKAVGETLNLDVSVLSESPVDDVRCSCRPAVERIVQYGAGFFFGHPMATAVPPAFVNQRHPVYCRK